MFSHTYDADRADYNARYLQANFNNSKGAIIKEIERRIKILLDEYDDNNKYDKYELKKLIRMHDGSIKYLAGKDNNYILTIEDGNNIDDIINQPTIRDQINSSLLKCAKAIIDIIPKTTPCRDDMLQ